MKAICKVCKKESDDVKPRFVGNEYKEPEPPFTQRQLISKMLLMCEPCYKRFKNGEIKLVTNK